MQANWPAFYYFCVTFLAWANGPVCKELFNEHQGHFSVTAEQEKGDSQKISPNQRDTIDKVLAFYGDKDAQWLSQLTHMEEPWRKARAGCADGEICTNTITKESMAIYYGGL